MNRPPSVGLGSNKTKRKGSSKMKTRQIYETVTNTIIDLLETHQLHWDRPWVLVDSENRPARNPLTDHQYSGINQFILSAVMLKKTYPKNTWGTYKQIQKAGGHVRKNEKSVSIIFYKSSYRYKDGRHVSPEIVNQLSLADMRAMGIESVPVLKTFNVFNVSQTEGLAEEFYKVNKAPELFDWEKDEKAEDLITSTNAVIDYKKQSKAFYNPREDKITLPIRDQFKSAEGFYETILHELGHWTGHKSRLNREFGKFGSQEYAFEELIAELSAAFMCVSLGFSKNISNNAAYLKHWLSILRQDNKAIFKAAASAQKASDLVFEAARLGKGSKKIPVFNTSLHQE